MYSHAFWRRGQRHQPRGETLKSTIVVDVDKGGHRVSRYLYSQFAEHLGRCIYDAIWVGPESPIPNDDGLRRDVVQALAALKLPALRWPGGCFADDYHWQDGIGAPANRPVRRNLWWSALETNQFGTDEFMRLCAALGTEAYICLNVGSGTPQEAREWVEYCTEERDTALSRLRAANGHPAPYEVPFWGIGNESWGCGGSMRPEYYADKYRNWSTFVRKAAHPSSKLIACGSHPGVYENWDSEFFDSLGKAVSFVDYLALHNYTWVESALDYTNDQYTEALANIEGMRRHIEEAIALCERTSTEEHRIGVILDEWGLWFRDADQEDLSQQSTMLDAVFAAASFQMFHTLPGLFMTNLAQTANVLQALVLTDGRKMLRTPTYHIWEMFIPHRDGMLLDCHTDALSASATAGADGTVALSVTNTSLTEEVELTIEGAGKVRSARVLAAENVRDHNTFDFPDRIVPKPLDALTLPPHSVAVFKLAE